MHARLWSRHTVNPTQPNPTQPHSTQPKTQPNPTHPNLTQPTPTQPNPTTTVTSFSSSQASADTQPAQCVSLYCSVHSVMQYQLQTTSQPSVS